MNHSPFEAPTLEEMNALLPAFDFKTLIAANPYRAVFLAEQRSLDRCVAIKILAPQTGSDPEFRSSFESTARSMARLNHPNLITVFDSGMVGEMLYFVMEFVPGKSLSRSASGRQVEFSQAMQLVEGICAGLADAHHHGIFHGSLNPTNILLNQAAEPKIGNFGIDDSDQPLKESAAGVDMASYVAPEIQGHPHTHSRKADIYAIGAILYELITGKPHAPGAQPPSSLSSCPKELDEIWLQATHPDPERRFADVPALHAALAGLSKKRIPATTRLAAASAKPGPPPAPAKTPAPANTPDQEPPPSPPLKNHPGINWKLIRNLFIIGILLIAISAAWDNLQKTRAQREIDAKRFQIEEEAAKQKAIEDARRRAEERARAAAATQTPPTPVIPEPEPEPIPETPEESLARLRLSLASGDRSEMPKGSIQRGDCDYFLVRESLSWPDAAWFAESHGAHLVIPSPAADLSWLVKNVADEEAFWLGAGRNGRRDWTLASGTLWKPAKEPTGTGIYLGADKHGFLRAASAAIRLPFILQWHRDGSNPGTLEAQLAATRSSLEQNAPVYPPGTRSFDDRHFLHVTRPITWREAVDLAATSGGHLAVPSSAAEISILEEMTQKIDAPDGLWIGAFIRDGAWLWITGEPWSSTKWSTGAVTDLPDSGLALLPDKGWDSRNLATPANGFIIEWSNDRKGGAAPANPKTGTPRETSSLRSRAGGLILAAHQQREQQLADNAKKLAWDLDSYLRSLNRSEQNSWSRHISLIKESVRNHRVPGSIPRSSGIMLSQKMAEITLYAARKQEEIDKAFIAEAEKLRIAFIAKMNEEITKASNAGEAALAKSHEKLLEGTADTQSWLSSFGIDPSTPPPAQPGLSDPGSISENDSGDLPSKASLTE